MYWFRWLHDGPIDHQAVAYGSDEYDVTRINGIIGCCRAFVHSHERWKWMTMSCYWKYVPLVFVVADRRLMNNWTDFPDMIQDIDRYLSCHLVITIRLKVLQEF